MTNFSLIILNAILFLHFFNNSWKLELKYSSNFCFQQWQFNYHRTIHKFKQKLYNKAFHFYDISLKNTLFLSGCSRNPLQINFQQIQAKCPKFLFIPPFNTILFTLKFIYLLVCTMNINGRTNFVINSKITWPIDWVCRFCFFL